MGFKALGVEPPLTAPDANNFILSFLQREHYRVALLEVATIVEDWNKGVVVNGKRVWLAPNTTHLENLARKLRVSAGD